MSAVLDKQKERCVTPDAPRGPLVACPAVAVPNFFSRAGPVGCVQNKAKSEIWDCLGPQECLGKQEVHPSEAPKRSLRELQVFNFDSHVFALEF